MDVNETPPSMFHCGTRSANSFTTRRTSDVNALDAPPDDEEASSTASASAAASAAPASVDAGFRLPLRLGLGPGWA